MEAGEAAPAPLARETLGPGPGMRCPCDVGVTRFVLCSANSPLRVLQCLQSGVCHVPF